MVLNVLGSTRAERNAVLCEEERVRAATGCLDDDFALQRFNLYRPRTFPSCICIGTAVVPLQS